MGYWFTRSELLSPEVEKRLKVYSVKIRDFNPARLRITDVGVVMDEHAVLMTAPVTLN